MSSTISLVCTVRDEAATIGPLLDSMLAQTRAPDEIVVNDCLSRDATPAIVERYIAAGHPVRLVRGGHNIPSGRNSAVRAARGAIVACTDAGLTLDPRWLERIVAPIERGEADIVGGFFRPAPQSLFEFALAATNYPDADEVRAERFLPFGQSVAFTRVTWEAVGGYPEWASHCEDLLFDLAVKRRGYRLVFVPDALVHFRPRENLAAFARQYYFYGRGDGAADLWHRRYAIRYAAYLGGLALLIAAVGRPWLLLLHLLGAAAYCRAPVRRVLRRGAARPVGDRVAAIALVPLLRAVGDLAKMVGYPRGALRRLRDAALRAETEAYRR